MTSSDTGMSICPLSMLDLPEYGPVSRFASLSIPTTAAHHFRMISALYKGEIPRLESNSAIADAKERGAGRASTGIVVRGPDGASRRMVGVTGDITGDPPARTPTRYGKGGAAAQRSAMSSRRARSCRPCSTTLPTGVTLFDRDFRWKFSNRPTLSAANIPRLPQARHRRRDMVRYQIERGDFGKVEDPKRCWRTCRAHARRRRQPL